MRLRLTLILTVFAALYGAIGVKLYHLQVAKNAYYAERAHALSALQNDFALRRGAISITDRAGNMIPLAVNKEFPIAYAVPKEVKDPEKTAAALAPLLALDALRLSKELDNPRQLFRIVKERLSPEEIRALESAKIEGVHIEKKDFRTYPFETLASQLVGFLGMTAEAEAPRGLYGVEKYYNDPLSSGDPVALTVDRNIQVQSEMILKNLVAKFGATGGSVIVMEPGTGKILALANAPDFNPNRYQSAPLKNFVNPAIQSMYEPGSVFKPVTMAIGIEKKAITPETTFTDTGSVTLNGKKIMNWDGKAHGRVTMTNVIEESINTGTVFASQKIGRKNFLEYVKKFGFGEPTGIDLPDEVEGSLANLERKNAQDIDYATAAFGQGTGVTPVQMIRAFAAIANGGLLMQPYVNAAGEPYEIRRVVSKETAKKVTAMMESAVEKARVAALPNHRIAGKTGTAQIAGRGGYEEAYFHTYIGFGPVSDPRFVGLIKIDRPDAPLAGATVVPAFKELASFIVSYYGIPPDKNIRPIPQ